MALIDGMLQELEQEAQTTRRVLERVPDNQLAWRPHAKARTHRPEPEERLGADSGARTDAGRA